MAFVLLLPVLLHLAGAKSSCPGMHGGEVARPEEGLCSEDYKDYYQQRREALLLDCGDICKYTRTGGNVAIRKATNCTRLWSSTLDAKEPIQWPPPKKPPCSMLADFNIDGRLRYWWHAERALEDSAPQMPSDIRGHSIWTFDMVETMIEAARHRYLKGNYNLRYTSLILDAISRMGVEGQRVLVVGSTNPWLEACFLAAGAESVTTLEYREIECRHPQIHTTTFEKMQHAFSRGEILPFDAVGSISSVEHSGLGRYGDPLNPWGDLMAMARIWCITRPTAAFLLAVPFEEEGDQLVFNAHRIYGPERYSHLTANWRVSWDSSATSSVDPECERPRILVREQEGQRANDGKQEGAVALKSTGAIRPSWPQYLYFEFNGRIIKAAFGLPGEDLSARARQIVTKHKIASGMGCGKVDYECTTAVLEGALRQQLCAPHASGGMDEERRAQLQSFRSTVLDPNDTDPKAKVLLSFMSTDVLHGKACRDLSAASRVLESSDGAIYDAYRCAYRLGDIVNAPSFLRGLGIYSDEVLDKKFKLQLADPVWRKAFLRAFPGSIASQYVRRAEVKYGRLIYEHHPDMALLCDVIDDSSVDGEVMPRADELVVHLRTGDRGNVNSIFFEAVVRAVEASGVRSVTILAAAHWWTAFEMATVQGEVGRLCEFVMNIHGDDQLSSCRHRRGSSADHDMRYMRESSFLLVHKGGFSAVAALASKGVVYFTSELDHLRRKAVRDLGVGRIVQLDASTSYSIYLKMEGPA